MKRSMRRRLLLTIGSMLLGACSAFTTLHPASPATERAPRPVPGTPWVDYRGVVHCHSYLSHDCDAPVERIAAACRETGIHFLVMTDHQSEASLRDAVRGMVGDTLFLAGAEVRSVHGTLLCFPLQRPLRRFQHPALLAREAAEQGGLAFVCHGESWRLPFDIEGMHGAEIVNLHAGAMTAGALGTVATGVFLPMRSMCERICVRDERVLTAFDRALQTRHPFTPIGGDDAHESVRLFGPLGGTLGTYRELFLTLTTHVLAAGLDEASIVDAFRRGRTYVSFDVFGDGTGFDFRAVDERGAVHVGGATIDPGGDLLLCVSTPSAGQIRLLRDGELVVARLGTQLELRDPACGVYRVEVATETGRPWLFSGSIKVARSIETQ